MKTVKWSDVAIGIIIVGSVWVGCAFGAVWLINASFAALSGNTVICVVVLAVILLALTKIRFTGNVAYGHAHGKNVSIVATHEGGHVVAGKELGGRIKSATVYQGWFSSGGWVEWVPPHSLHSEKGIQAQVTFLRAGEYAAGTRDGCGYDRESVNYFLKRLPANRRSAVVARAESRARSIVNNNRSAIQSVAQSLEK